MLNNTQNQIRTEATNTAAELIQMALFYRTLDDRRTMRVVSKAAIAWLMFAQDKITMADVLNRIDTRKQ